MLTACRLVYKVMKKVGKLTEASMVKPPEPKFHPLVSDDLFENRVKGYPSKGIKGGTKAAAKMAKRLKEDDLEDLPMNKTPEASKMTTNSPRRATSKSVQVGGPFDLTAEATDDWIGDAEDDIERRGTKGKCTPITKKGCTGKAKTLAKTFKKMAKKAKNESTTPKPVRQVRARAEAGKPLKKGTAKMVANDAGSEMGSRMKAAEKL
jgi:hypothetical protein